MIVALLFVIKKPYPFPSQMNYIENSFCRLSITKLNNLKKSSNLVFKY